MQQNCSAQMQVLTKQAEIELVACVRQDPRTFRRLYEQYARPVYRYLYSPAGNQADAEDLTSQVFLKALEDLDQFRNQGGFQAWLFTIARSKAMDAYRKQRRELPLEDVQLVSRDPDPLASAIRRDEVERMRGLLSTLSEEEQELIQLRFAGGLSFAEIGAVLRLSEGAVKKALYRLLARLGDQVRAIRRPDGSTWQAGGESWLPYYDFPPSIMINRSKSGSSGLVAELYLNATAANGVDLLTGRYEIELDGASVIVPGPWELSFGLGK